MSLRAPSPSDSGSDRPRSASGSERPPARRLSRRQRNDELRAKIRTEIEEELKATQSTLTSNEQPDGVDVKDAQNFPARALTVEEYEAVTSSKEFLDFAERSTKVIERALDDEYDVLADYRHGDLVLEDEDDEIGAKGKKGRRIKEVIQFYDEKGSHKRMISDVDFSPKVIVTSTGVRKE